VGLRPHACRDCGFESRRRRGCLSLVSVLCYQVWVSATDCSPSSGVLPSVVCLECDRTASTIMRPCPSRGYPAVKNRHILLLTNLSLIEYRSSHLNLNIKSSDMLQLVRWCRSFDGAECRHLQGQRVQPLDTEDEDTAFFETPVTADAPQCTTPLA